MYNVNDLTLSPTNLLESNLVAGANMTITKGAKGKLTFASSGGVGSSTTNYDGVYISNSIFSSTYTFKTTTNVPTGILSFEWGTNVARAAVTVASNALATSVANLQGATNGLDSRLTTTSNSLRTDISNLQGGTNGLRTDVLNLQGGTNGIDSRLTTTSNALRTDIANLQGATNGLTTRAANLEGATNGLRTDVLNLQGGTNGLDGRVTAQTNIFRTDISNLQGGTNGLRTDVLNLQGGTNGLNTRAANLEGGTNGLNTGVEGLLSRAITNGDTRASSVINLSASNFVSTNISIRAGSSASNAFVGGTIWSTIIAVANPTSNGTLAATVTIPIAAHTMTNNGDRVVARFIGTFPTAQANTNEFALVINNGGPNVSLMDTGLQTSSNCTYIVEIHMTRSGVSSHIVDSHVDWGPGGGVPFAKTNTVVVTTTTTNGLALNLILQSTARRQGSHTNLIARAWFDPAPR